MRQPNEKGPGVAPPEPQNIAFPSNAVFLYSEHYQHGNQNEHWLVVPRSIFEWPLETIVEQLEAIDGRAEQRHSNSQAPENAL